MRDQVDLTEAVATRAALQLELDTWAANEHTIEETNADGTSRKKTVRDNQGDPKAAALRRQRAEPAKTPPQEHSEGQGTS